MAWVRIDDSFPDHPKAVQAGPLACWLYVCSIAYANRYLTDGFIPERQIWRLIDSDDAEALADALIDSGLWEQADGGYQIHDYLDYQPSAERVKSERDMNAVRKELYADPFLVKEIRRRDGDNCRYCGRDVRWNDRKGSGGATYDHVEPRGGNSLENLVVCCRGCNAKKGKRNPEQAGMALLEPGTRSELDPIQPESTHIPSNNPNTRTSTGKRVVGEEKIGAKTRKPLPTNGPAQVLVKTWADRAGSEPANYGKAAGQASQLVKAGVEPSELLDMFDWFAASQFWQEAGFDLGSCVSQVEKFRQAKRTPKTTNGRASPVRQSNYDISAANIDAAGEPDDPFGIVGPIYETTGRIRP